MASRHLSVRLDAKTFDRLDSESRRTGQTRSHLAKTLLQEGLRMERHPGIVFRSGPAGRRPALADGPDVWEIVRVFRGIDAHGDAAILQTAELTHLDPERVRTAIRYYAEFTEEIDDWIQMADQYAAEAEATWLREQSLLR